MDKRNFNMNTAVCQGGCLAEIEIIVGIQ